LDESFHACLWVLSGLAPTANSVCSSAFSLAFEKLLSGWMSMVVTVNVT